MGLSRTVSEINCDFGQKLQIFPPHVLMPLLMEVPWDFCNSGSAAETIVIIMPYQTVERV